MNWKGWMKIQGNIQKCSNQVHHKSLLAQKTIVLDLVKMKSTDMLNLLIFIMFWLYCDMILQNCTLTWRNELMSLSSDAPRASFSFTIQRWYRGGTVVFSCGKRTHYFHQCLYFGQSARGGGWKCQDPVITLFKWYYRLLRRRLANSPSAVQKAYDQYVKEKKMMGLNTMLKWEWLSIQLLMTITQCKPTNLRSPVQFQSRQISP